LATRSYRMYISPVPEYILGVDVLQGLWLETTVGDFYYMRSKNGGVGASTPLSSMCASTSIDKCL
jgi:hypothetical protein